MIEDPVGEPGSLTEALLISLVELSGRMVVNLDRCATALEKLAGQPSPGRKTRPARGERARRCDDCGSSLIADGKCKSCGAALGPDGEA